MLLGALILRGYGTINDPKREVINSDSFISYTITYDDIDPTEDQISFNKERQAGHRIV